MQILIDNDGSGFTQESNGRAQADISTPDATKVRLPSPPFQVSAASTQSRSQKSKKLEMLYH